MSGQAGEAEKYVQSIGILSDSVSDEFKVQNNCGSFQYELEDLQGEPAPDYINIVYT